MVLVNDCRSDVTAVNNSDSDSDCRLTYIHLCSRLASPRYDQCMVVAFPDYLCGTRPR